MGKGGGCVPSKKKYPTPAAALDEAPATAADEASAPISPEPGQNLKLLIVFYSMYGHVEGLARRIKRAVDSVDGIEAVFYRVPETLTDEALTKIRGPPKDDSIPVIGSPRDLAGADGFLFGFPVEDEVKK